jgi:hypothetical protein
MFKNKKGSEFVGIRNYMNQKGEVSNQTLNVGIDVLKAKQKDLKALQNLSISELKKIADANKIDLKIAESALSELLMSELKNVSTEKELRTKASQAQADTYTYINKGMKIHNETGALYVSGFVVSKTVIVEGEYKTVNSADKTIMKNLIKKHLNFKMNSFRSFSFVNADSYKINGTEIILLRS